MIRLAFYGKGGIGKSTTVSNIAAAFADMGLKVMQIGCDPKADSTLLLHNCSKAETILDVIKKQRTDYTLNDLIIRGYKDVICAEAGGPTPGQGCAGRGIIVALEKLAEKGAYTTLQPDIVLYDVLGDVVCGGFSMPMRGEYSDKVYIITSGENMSLHAANNIAIAVESFKDRGYASLGGLILNKRNVKDEDAKVNTLAKEINSKIISTLNHSETVLKAEELGKTVIESFPDSQMASEYITLAQNILKECGVNYKC